MGSTIINMSQKDFTKMVQDKFNYCYTKEEYEKLSKEEKKFFINHIIQNTILDNELKMIIKELDNTCEKIVIKNNLRNHLLNLEEINDY